MFTAYRLYCGHPGAIHSDAQPGAAMWQLKADSGVLAGDDHSERAVYAYEVWLRHLGVLRWGNADDLYDVGAR